MPYTASDRRLLYHVLVECFNLDKLATLVLSELGLNPETFPQTTRPAFCRALVLHYEQRGQVRALVQALLSERDSQPLVALLDRLADEVAREADPPAGVTLAAGSIAVGGDIVGGDKVTIIQHLTALPGLPTDYGARIQNFLHEYLGTPDQRVPFGGRAQELESLDSWLTDETAPPYALLTAEAGRGKSALLVRWLTELEAWGETAVVFVPVSIRFNTALASVVFTALAARLGEVYGEPIKWADLSADQWRGVCQSYLSRTPPDGKRVVIILDGLDEAADWQAGADLFPRVPPAGIRVVVSARYLAGDTDERGWRGRLGWEQERLARSIPLPLLTREGVAAVLAAMGNPLDGLATRVDAVGELFRLSEGDPLLVRLYVEALLPYGEQVALLTPETLQRLQPGLAGYFDRWWAEQRQQWGKETPLRERGVKAVLHLLASALGPLDQATLLELAPPESDLGSLTLTDALAPLARFIVGDGKGMGYTFNHPRLGYYFWEALTPAEQRQWEGRFLAHGAQVLGALNQGSLAPQAAPAYAVKYYGAHLERAKASDAALYALISGGWMRAWEALEGTHAGFLNDVARAWQRADAALAAGREQDEALVQQIRAALCQASVAALSANISANLLALAVKHGLRNPVQAFALVHQASDEAQREKLLVALIPYLPSIWHAQALEVACALPEWSGAIVLSTLAPYLSEELLQVAFRAACTIKYEEARMAALTGLAPYLGTAGVQLVLDTARAIEDEEKRAAALTALASHLSAEVRPQVVVEALALVCDIQSEERQTAALMDLAPYLSTEGLQLALDTARAIRDREWRVAALAVLAPHLEVDIQREVLADALRSAREIWHEGSRADALIALMPHLEVDVQRRVLVEALRSARDIPNSSWRATALTALVSYLEVDAQRQVVREVLAATRGRDLVGEWNRADALANIAPHLSAKDLEVALDAACAIESGGRRSRALLGLAPYLSSEGLGLALDAARAIKDEASRVFALTALSSHLDVDVQHQVLAEALASARAIGGEGSWAALNTLVPYFNAENLRGAIDIALAIKSEERRAAALTDLAPYLNGSARQQVLAEALSATCAIEGEGSRANTLANLAPHLNAKNLQVALDTARTIDSAESRATALTGLVPYMGTNIQHLVLAKALKTARAIEADRSRVAALCALTPHLSAAAQGQVLAEALAAAQSILHEGERADALTNLATHLSTDTHSQVAADALDVAHSIQEAGIRAAALTAFTLYLSADVERRKVLTEALNAVCVVEDEDSLAPPYRLPFDPQHALDTERAIEAKSRRVATTLTALAPHLSSASLQRALGAARTIEVKDRRVATLAALASYLDADVQCQVLGEALSSARAIWNEESRVVALAGLVSHLGVDDRCQILTEALDTACIIKYDEGRASALAILAPHLATWATSNPTAALPHWTATLHYLARHPRPDFLADLAALLPFALALAGEEKEQVAEGIARAIQEVCTWWP